MSSPRYHTYLNIRGYTNERPEEFENPIEFSFDKRSTCDIEGCSNIAVVSMFSWSHYI